jgi:hypothetical protein
MNTVVIRAVIIAKMTFLVPISGTVGEGLGEYEGKAD